ncbi:MAG: TIM barrel protein [Firmicutes bacterium]|nr:TIM barrel protein [Bacillota bacterium]
MKALFGPGGNSESFYAEGKKHTFQAPAWLREKGLGAYEYQAGNGITGSADTFRKIGEEAKLNGIALSFHAPYFISLSGAVTETRLKSIGYIKKSLEAADLMEAGIIVVHAGSAGKLERGEAMELAKDTLYKALEETDGASAYIGVETMGKQNQLGTLEEVVELCKLDKRLRPVVDFGHLNARNLGGLYTCPDDYRAVFDYVGCRLGAEYANSLHCHFSKIEYTKGGEKKHLTFLDNIFGPDFEPLCEAIAKDGLAPRIICESSGTMAEDALAMQTAYEYYAGA